MSKFECVTGAAGPAVAIAAAALAISCPAWAGGSIPLSEVLEVTKSSTALTEEVSKSLASAKTGSDEVVCSATRLGRHFESLGGARIAPYECEIGGRVLEVEAKVRMFDKEGTELKSGDPEAPAKAAKVTEEDFQWTWRPAE